MKVMYFSTSTCAPCRTLKPIVQEVSMETGIPVEWIDAQQRSDLAQTFRVTAVPTIIVIKDGQSPLRHTGMASKQQIQSLFN